MDKIVTPLTLRQLLLYCSNRSSPHWESGWREFIRRYKMTIYKNVAGYCSSWHLPRLKFQFSEVVDDIVVDVHYYLCRDDFKALKSFREYENEKRFLAWLASICNCRSSHHLQSFFTKALSEDKIDDLRDSIAALDSDMRQELYEAVVTSLRLSAGKKKPYLERDIHIFMLGLYSELSPTKIPSLPTIPRLSTKSVYSIIERLRHSLKKNKKYFF